MPMLRLSGNCPVARPARSLPGDALARPCADEVASSSSALESAMLDDPCLQDVAPYPVVPHPPPRNHASLALLGAQRRVAIATAVHQPRGTARFLEPGSSNESDVLPCAIVVHALALRSIGGIPPSVDIVTVHSNLTPSQLALIAEHNVKLHEGALPPAANYPKEYERASMIKVDVASMTQYERVLFVDVDMYPRAPVGRHLTTEFPEGLVHHAEPTAIHGSNLFVIRPSADVHAALRVLADARSFSVARGWNDSGLLTWPDVGDQRAHCRAAYLTRRGRGGASCPLWPFWRERCERFGVTNWVHVAASGDQGLFYYVFNMPSHGSHRSGRSTQRTLVHPRDADGKVFLGPGAPWWAHLQSSCKPWLVSAATLTRAPPAGSQQQGVAHIDAATFLTPWKARALPLAIADCSRPGLMCTAQAKCLKFNAFFWHGVWDRLKARPVQPLEQSGPSFPVACPTCPHMRQAAHSLESTCPSFSAAYKRFVSIAPKEAALPCFWSEECFRRYRPSWVTTE